MKKHKKSLFLALFLIFIYIFIFYNTNSVVEDFKKCISGKNVSYELASTELYRYFDDFGGTVFDADADVYRLFVLHNFKKGVMYVKYSYKTFDKNGIKVRNSTGVYSKWYIEKINGRWNVIDIKEKP